MNDFYRELEYSSGEEQQFQLGYLIHVLTDLFWENTILRTFSERYEADTEAIQDRRMAYYNDTDQLDFVFYNRVNWRPEVWRLLEQARGFPIADAVSQKEVAVWKNRTLNWYLSGKSEHGNPVKYLSYEDLDGFTVYAAAKCEEYLLEKHLRI